MDPLANFVRVWPINALTIFLAGLLLTTGARSDAQTTGQASTAGLGACVGDNGGIMLSPGFCATVFADKLGHARHLAVTPNGSSTSTPGAVSIITTTRRHPAGF
jgi:hypothetical protein